MSDYGDMNQFEKLIGVMEEPGKDATLMRAKDAFAIIYREENSNRRPAGLRQTSLSVRLSSCGGFLNFSSSTLGLLNMHYTIDAKVLPMYIANLKGERLDQANTAMEYYKTMRLTYEGAGEGEENSILSAVKTALVPITGMVLMRCSELSDLSKAPWTNLNSTSILGLVDLQTLEVGNRNSAEILHALLQRIATLQSHGIKLPTKVIMAFLLKCLAEIPSLKAARTEYDTFNMSKLGNSALYRWTMNTTLALPNIASGTMLYGRNSFLEFTDDIDTDLAYTIKGQADYISKAKIIFKSGPRIAEIDFIMAGEEDQAAVLDATASDLCVTPSKASELHRNLAGAIKTLTTITMQLARTAGEKLQQERRDALPDQYARLQDIFRRNAAMTNPQNLTDGTINTATLNNFKRTLIAEADSDNASNAKEQKRTKRAPSKRNNGQPDPRGPMLSCDTCDWLGLRVKATNESTGR